MRIVRHPKFLEDLFDAYTWIASDNQKMAERLLDCVDATLERLRQPPLIGASRPALGEALRSIRVRPFRHQIFYRLERDEIALMRLLHGARALEHQDYET